VTPPLLAPAAELRPDLAPFDRVKFWSVYRWTPDGVRVIPLEGTGRLGAHRIVRKNGVGHCLRVALTDDEGAGIAYVPLDAARHFDPNQLAFDVA
jgi:hypothetical protein